MTINGREIDAFTSAYIEAAFWASMDESDSNGGDPLDQHYGAEDLDPEALDKMIADCRKFQEDHRALIDQGPVRLPPNCTVAEHAGHDFWLTRNRSGCGFWDGDWPDEAGRIMTDAAHAFGECMLYVGDDGKIYL